MLSADPLLPGAAALADTKSYLRVPGNDEDALIAGLVTGAAELCETFVGQALLERGFTETIPSSTSWIRLRRTPVTAILAVEAIGTGGVSTLVPTDGYALDIDGNGDGWVRLTGALPGRSIRVRYSAGMTGSWDGLPQAMRQGIVRLPARARRSGQGSCSTCPSVSRRIGFTSAGRRSRPARRQAWP